MGDIADDCFDRAMNELMDGYGDEEPDQYEGVWRSARTPYIAATRAEVLDDFEDEDEVAENDLEGLLYGAVQQSIWDYGERDVSAIVNAVMRVLAEHDYI